MMTMPKRVAGGVVVLVSNNKSKKKKGRRQLLGNPNATRQKITTDGSRDGGSNIIGSAASEPASSSPRTGKDCNINANFDDNDEDDFMDANDIPNDALLCLQAYTRPTNSETCAYCPIFTKQSSFVGESSAATTQQQLGARSSTADDKDDFAAAAAAAAVEISTHAAPMLPKLVLLHHLVNNAAISSYHPSLAASASMMRGHAERAVDHIALSNDVRLLQLLGTAVTKTSTTSSSWRGDGNDDDDVVLMETSVYTAAAQMALQTSCFGEHPATAAAAAAMEDKTAIVFRWFTNVLLPYFAGKTWFSSGSLSSLFHHQNRSLCKANHDYDDDVDDNHDSDNLVMNRKKRRYNHVNNDPMSGTDSTQGMHNQYSYSIKQMERMIQQLVQAGLLLPRRRCGDGDDGYWFSLPGLGKAAKSIVNGRTNLLRRLQSTRYKEKKRLILEQDLEESGRKKRTTKSGTKMTEVEQSGKFIVLDVLSKGWIQIHETTTGEQFVRLS